MKKKEQSEMQDFEEEKRLIVFLDILGFKNLYNLERQKAMSFISLLRKNNRNHHLEVTQETDNSKRVEFAPSLFTANDNVILSFPVISDFGVLGAALIRTSEYLSSICVYALGLGIALRGCISFGKMTFNPQENIILGTPLFEARDYESSNILYPRIVILPSTYDLLKDTAITSSKILPKWHDLIDGMNYVDVDGYVCIDWIKRYLHISSGTFDMNGEKMVGVSNDAVSTVQKIREPILRAMKKFNEDGTVRIYQKWCYLANYFNQSLSAHFEEFKERGYAIEPIDIEPFGLMSGH